MDHVSPNASNPCNSSTKPTEGIAPLWLPVIVSAVVALVVRAPALFQGSPWIDELTTWVWSSRVGLFPDFTNHWLTRFLQGLGLSISDSLFGLRLHSVLLGSVTPALIAFWLTRRFGAVHGLLAGILGAISPMAVFYSQDATHYAGLIFAGAVALVFADMVQEVAGWRRIFLAASGAAILLPCMGFHPMAAVPLLAYTAAVFLILLRDAVQKRATLPERILLLLMAIGGLAVFAWLLQRDFNAMLARGGGDPGDGRRMGWNADFILTLLASFFGGIYRYTTLDSILGVTGLLLALLGWWRGITRHRMFAASLVMVMICLGAFAVLILVPMRQYFSPRYVSALLPALLIGVAIGAGDVVSRCSAARSRKSPSITVTSATGLVVVFLFLFSGRAAWWLVMMFGGSTQPFLEVIDTAQTQLPPNAIVATRHRYGSAGVDFLWNRQDMGGRQHLPLGFGFLFGGHSIQQVEETIWRGNNDVWFLWQQENLQPKDFTAWLQATSSEVIHFPSSVLDFFNPTDLSLRLHRIDKASIQRNPLSLPRRGDRPSAILGEYLVRIHQSEASLHPALPPGTTVAWNFETTSSLVGIDFTYHLTVVPQSRPMIIAVSDNNAWSIDLNPSAGINTIRLPGEFIRGNHRLELIFQEQTGGLDGSSYLFPVEVAAVSPRSNFAPPNASQFVLTETLPLKHEVPQKLNGPAHIAEVAVPMANYQGGDLLVVRRIHPQSISGRIGIYHQISLGPPTPDNQPATMHRLIDWTSEPIAIAKLLKEQPDAKSITIKVHFTPFLSYHPSKGWSGDEPLLIFQRETSEP